MKRSGRSHYVANKRVEAAAGLAALVVGAILLHDAYEARARPQPIWLKPLSWW